MAIRDHPAASSRLAIGTCLVALTAIGACSDSGDSESCGRDTTLAPIDATEHPIVFSSTREGTFDLWLIKENGSDPLQLTTCSGDEGFASWSPDGRQIAYAGTVSEGEPADIYVINADGTDQRQLTKTDDRDEGAPSWSPDGRQILYEVPGGSDTGHAHVMNDDGTDQRQLTDVIATWFDWSPDGESIVYTGANEARDDTQLMLMNADGTGHTRLGDDTITTPSEPTWSPDGSLIAFISPSGDYAAEDPFEWNEDIFVINPDGTGIRQVTDAEGNDHWPPAWSPDSKRILYTADGRQDGADFNGELMIVNLATGETTQLTDHDAYDGLPAWRG